METQSTRNPTVIIIGAGMTGILMSIKLREMGITDITILEKTDNVGGTWRENTYPGVACDVPAHLYTYTFERNPDWSHRYAHGAEIQQYFEKVARKYGVTEKVRFNEAVTAAHYEKGKWTVETSKGDTLLADFVVSATGILHHPAKPHFEGLEDYQGTVFHTAEWDHSVDLKGKRVGIIGTGSTAAQAISELPPVASKLTVFQRTAQWILPTPNREFNGKLKKKCRENPFRIPMANLVYSTIFEQIFSKAVTGHKIAHGIVSYLCKRNLKKKVKDPVLREKLTPNYKVGCKRLVMSGTFYDAIQQPNVELLTEGIKRFTEHGIETADGVVHELDVVIMSTGFDPAAFMRPMNLVGKSGQDIDTHWKNKIQAYRSLFIPDYPNFFLMLGPNTPIGNFNVIQMSEVQTGYVQKMLEHWRNREFDEVAATPEALKRYNQYLKAGMGKTVWVSGGCSSWYLDADGDPLTWPYTWKQWVREMAEPDMADFETVSYPPDETELPIPQRRKAA
jgi:cation diffusion facilitator CzcD-associated flavoprotein CzcO